jgi:hypothetical protein
MDNFNLKKFLVENKITQNSKLFEADDFEFTDLDKDLANKLSNEVELKIGDTITPDMWDKQAFEDEDGDLSNYNTTIQDSYLIKDMRYDEGDDEAGADWLVDLRSVTTGKNFGITGTPEELTFLNDVLKDNYRIITPDMNEADDFEFTNTDKDLANQLDLENDLKKTFLKLWDEHITDDYLSLINTNNVIYDGLDKVLKDPKLKEKIFNNAYDRIADEDFEDEEERYNDFQGSVIDEIDYSIMAEFAPQLARNLLTAGFKYDSDEDMWTSPKSNQFTSYGIIWDVWGVDYDTSVRETISEYLEQAAQELT